ncbi:hypothetical protein EZS27_043125, partial [termite gut metagenome]
RVVRAGSFCGIIGGMKRFHLAAGNLCQAMDTYRKVIPRTNSLGAEMINPANETFIYNRNINFPFTQNRDKNRENIEAVIKIFAEYIVFLPFLSNDIFLSSI